MKTTMMLVVKVKAGVVMQIEHPKVLGGIEECILKRIKKIM